MLKTSRRLRLRTSTAATHEKLDARLGELRSTEDYAHYLRVLHAFRAPVEAAFASAPWPGAMGNWRPLQVADLMRQDMCDIGVEPHVASFDASPFFSNGHAIFGLSYVLEGSSLGARLLHRRAQALGFRDGWGARHLARQAASGENWRDFLGLLDAAPDLDESKAEDAARRAFVVLGNLAAGGDVAL